MVRRSPTLLAPLMLVAAAGLVACTSLREGSLSDDPGPSPSASTTNGSPTPSPPPSLPISPEGGNAVTTPGPAFGAGPFGALPNGYCCADAKDCRSRRCESGMCIDTCGDDDGCLDTAGEFSCQGPPREKVCVPKGALTCVPAADFRRGDKKLGACCTATHDARAGLECEGGRCDAFGPPSNPYICGQACERPSDCPGAFACMPGPYGFRICIPESTETYTCK